MPSYSLPSLQLQHCFGHNGPVYCSLPTIWASIVLWCVLTVFSATDVHPLKIQFRHASLPVSVCVCLYLFVQTNYARQAPVTLQNFQMEETNSTAFSPRAIPPFFKVDHFFPSIGGGVPLFHHYQHLPHVVAATIAQVAETLFNVKVPYAAETDGLALLFLCAMPVIIYRCLRALQFRVGSAAVASFL